MGRRTVQVGQRYRDHKAWDFVWEVEAVVAGRGPAHAKLRGAKFPKERRTLACTVLLDRERFELIDGDIDTGAASR